MKTKAVIGGGVAIIAMVLLILSFNSPWYSYTSVSEEEDLEANFYLGEVETTVNGESSTQSYEESDLDEVGSTFWITEIFLMIAAVGTILGSVGAMLVAFDILDPDKGASLAVIGLVFSFLSMTYLWLDLPSSFNDDLEELPWEERGPHEGVQHFWGGASRAGVERRWRPGMGWFLALVAGMLNIIVFRVTRAARRTGTERSPAREETRPPAQDEVRR